MTAKQAIAKFEDFAASTGSTKSCRLATFAVLGLEMAEAFGANIPNYATVLAEMEAMQAEACSTT